jgi:hypothetical protein
MAKKRETEVDLVEFTRARITLALIGDSPLILNRLSQKAKRELLFPAGRMTAAERATRLKHQPIEEYRAAAHVLADEAAPTLLALPASAFKKAMGTAALDMPGARKAQIGRLAYVEGEYVPVYGRPQLKMDPVRSADIARTPDIRTRVALRRWAATVTIAFAVPALRERALVNLLAAAGMTAGVGDGRVEKGTFSFGRWRLCNPDDPEFLDITTNEGRKVQQEALDNPEPYDEETE